MKVIFLDIDGVLNNYDYAMKRYNEKCEQAGVSSHAHSVINDCYDHFDPISVKVLNDVLLLVNGVKVVISSAWRLSNTLDEIRAHFEDQGIKNCNIVSQTPYLSQKKRGEEIDAWLDKNHLITDFVIIDDADDMYPHKEHLVQTTFEKGLRGAHINRILDVLGETHE
jgi:hypothetical protein